MITRVLAVLFLLALMTGTAPAQRKKERPKRDAYAGSTYEPGARSMRSRRDNLPARVTRPDRYIYDDYPEWAAKAFEPNSPR
jgi:hypothetical protein